jgi:Fe-S-cluster containining protein
MTSTEQPTPAARPEWHSCRAKACCSRGARDVNGADIVRISRGLAMEPWHFTQTVPAASDDAAGIVVDRGRRRVGLTLATAAQGCVFLVRSLSGAACCGIGDLAPTSCRAFPADLAASTAAQAPVERRDTGCVCREWTESDLSPEDLAEPMQTWASHRAHWLALIARWNAASAKADGTSIEDFQRYVLEADESRSAGLPWPEDVRP